MEKSEIIRELRAAPAHVTFEKLDGSKRDMTVTLEPQVTGFSDADYENLEKLGGPDSLRVYSVYDDGFRTLNIKTLSRFNIIEAAGV